MPFLPHDKELEGDLSALPKNAHAIQKLDDKLVSSYAHHGFLLMTITWKKLSMEKKCTFTNHHVLISAKVIMIGLALYPYLLIVTGLAEFCDPFIRGTAYTPASATTNGDVIIVATAIFIAMYLHEHRFFSSLVSWISVMHHLEACVVASIMVTRNVRWEVESSTAAYTVLIMTYGIFDLLAGLWRRPCVVVRTVWPEKHRLNMRLCYAACALTVLGTIGETIVAMYLFGTNHKAWSVAIQCVTPISHALFAWAQLSSSLIMWKLAKKAERQLKQVVDEEEHATTPSTSRTTSPADCT